MGSLRAAPFAALLIAALLSAFLGALPGHAVEAVNVRTDVTAIDLTGVAELVIEFPFFGITNDFVGGVNFFEFFFGAGFFISVRVILKGELAIGRLDLGIISRLGQT